MRDNRVIIIGAGLAGLAAGCYAQMNGYDSLIVEHHAHAGGVASAWRRGEYLIDGGIHFVMGHRPGVALYDLYRELGIMPACHCVDLDTYGRFVHEPSGRSVTLTADLDRAAADLKALSPEDGRIVDHLMQGARGLRGLDLSTAGLGLPPELRTLRGSLREYWDMRKMLPYVTGRYSHSIARYVRDVREPVLRSCIESLFTPDVPVFFVCMIFALLADGQLGLLEGGCTDFVQAMVRRYRVLGGTVEYGATVKEILVNEGRARGVRLEDGRELDAGAVVSAADGASAIFGLLGGRYLSDKIRRRYDSWPRFRPLMMLSFGVNRSFPGELPFSTLALERPLAVAGEQVPSLMVRLFNYSGRFAPPGKTVVQVEFETGWTYWDELQRRDRAGYDAAKAATAEQVLLRLDTHYPGISAQVELTDVATPYTFWRYTRNDRGSWEGWMITPKTMTSSIERTLPGLADFYMAGQWVTPGGGVPPVLYTGRHAVQLLCRRDGRSFTADAQGTTTS